MGHSALGTSSTWGETRPGFGVLRLAPPLRRGARSVQAPLDQLAVLGDVELIGLSVQRKLDLEHHLSPFRVALDVLDLTALGLSIDRGAHGRGKLLEGDVLVRVARA